MSAMGRLPTVRLWGDSRQAAFPPESGTAASGRADARRVLANGRGGVETSR